MVDHHALDDDLFEKLAAIEHERWADWQTYLHGKCEITQLYGGIVVKYIPAKLYHHWEQQIATPYDQLTEQEKESDREQVRRYWHLIRPGVPPMKPSIGRHTHYVAYGTPGGEYAAGAHRHAEITQVNDDDTVGLFIVNPTGTFFNTSVKEDPTGTTPGTWHWPERVED